MENMWFFLLVFTAIYGAVRLIAVIYDGVINYIRHKGKRKNNAGKRTKSTRAARNR